MGLKGSKWVLLPPSWKALAHALSNLGQCRNSGELVVGGDEGTRCGAKRAKRGEEKRHRQRSRSEGERRKDHTHHPRNLSARKTTWVVRMPSVLTAIKRHACGKARLSRTKRGREGGKEASKEEEGAEGGKEAQGSQARTRWADNNGEHKKRESWFAYP